MPLMPLLMPFHAIFCLFLLIIARLIYAASRQLSPLFTPSDTLPHYAASHITPCRFQPPEPTPLR
jgi:hypothetical protein